MRRVLLFTDNGSIMDRTAWMLEDMGWELYIASSHKAALWLCVARRPRLVIVDIEMRGGVGLETISTIRRSDKRPFIIAVTRGSRDATLLKVAEVFGADNHVIGPVSAKKLSAAIEAGQTSGRFGPVAIVPSRETAS